MNEFDQFSANLNSSKVCASFPKFCLLNVSTKTLALTFKLPEAHCHNYYVSRPKICLKHVYILYPRKHPSSATVTFFVENKSKNKLSQKSFLENKNKN